MELSLLHQLDEQILFHSLEDVFIRDEVHSLDTQDYSIAAGGEAVEFVFKPTVLIEQNTPRGTKSDGGY